MSDPKRTQLQIAALLQRFDGLDKADQTIVRRALEDAADANIPPGLPAASSASLRHPMSGETIDKHVDVKASRLKLDATCERLQEGKTIDQIWFALAESDARSVPASDVLPDHSVLAKRSLAAALAGARHGNERAALLYMHIGPVQSFIGASRRTHDLFVSSFCIAYLTMTAIKVIAEDQGVPSIVVPWLAEIPLARKLLDVQDYEGDERSALLRSSVPNKVLAIVPVSCAEALAAKAAQEVRTTWKAMATSVQNALDAQARSAAKGLAWDTDWDVQIDHHLEIDAIVQPWPNTREAVRALLARAQTLGPFDDLLGEKDWGGNEAENRVGTAFGALYDLTHRVMAAHRKTDPGPAITGDRRPKCPICGLREQMGPIAPNPARQESATRNFFHALHTNLDQSTGERLQFADGEGLCAVCLTKRFASRYYFGSGAKPFGIHWDLDAHLLRYPSIPSIASAPFRYWVNSNVAELGGKLGDCVEKAVDGGRAFPGNMLPGLGGLGGNGLLALEGWWFYDAAYDSKTAWANNFSGRWEDNRDSEKGQRLIRNLPAAHTTLRQMYRELDAQPSSYYAVLVLDGDKMGKWLTGQHRCIPKLGEFNEEIGESLRDRRRPFGPALQGDLSQRTSALAVALYDIVETNHLGRIVYSGGDDLLAFLPLATVLPCVRAIREKARSTEFLGNRFTLSAGISITHVRTPLREALALAREAEKCAKKNHGDCFTVTLEPRSGGQSTLTLPFLAARRGADPVNVIDGLIALLEWDAARARKERTTPEDDDDHPLRSLRIAYQLDEEVEVLAELGNPAPFQSRLKGLLGKGIRDDSPGRPLLFDVDFDAKTIVTILHLVRFLLREERGIPTKKLLDSLDPERQKA